MAFIDDIQKYLEIGVQASKDALSKAGDAVSKFSDESIIRIEKKQFEHKLNQEITALGLTVLKAFEDEKKESIGSDEPEIITHINKIKEIKTEITKREGLLK